MIKIVIVTHGSLAKALVETSRLIIGTESDIDVIGLNSEESPENFKLKVSDCIDKYIERKGVLIFTDLYGGTPSNSVLAKLSELAFPDNIVSYVGVNLPLLLEAISLSNNLSIQELGDHLDQVASSSFVNLTKLFGSS